MKPVILKFVHSPESPRMLVKTDFWAPPKSFSISRYGMGLDNLHF